MLCFPPLSCSLALLPLGLDSGGGGGRRGEPHERRGAEQPCLFRQQIYYECLEHGEFRVFPPPQRIYLVRVLGPSFR